MAIDTSKQYDGFAEVAEKQRVPFHFEDVKDLAGVANQWRNELAHEKREYEPDRRVIDSVRLVEHLNYCIALRHAGFTDENIKAIVEEVLAR